MEPESGSEGSSTVEPVQVTRTRTTTALLGAMLMHSIKRLASEADKAGRRPVIMLHYDLAASTQKSSCGCRCSRQCCGRRPFGIPTSVTTPLLKSEF